MEKERSVNHSLDPNSPARYKIFAIGEAPGADEDKNGLPFYGRAGNNFRDFLQTMGIDLNIVYVTNIVKCRPPKNRVFT
jgi:DNA polymerase